MRNNQSHLNTFHKSSISIYVHSLDLTGLGGMDAGAKPSGTNSWRPVKSRECT
ncbi:MAG: hypothetical protein GY808_12225 [Gammaproteobacteria bacterium]|nr:hypothetical protein [Gammaproteobacteria bacterium]